MMSSSLALSKHSSRSLEPSTAGETSLLCCCCPGPGTKLSEGTVHCKLYRGTFISDHAPFPFNRLWIDFLSKMKIPTNRANHSYATPMETRDMVPPKTSASVQTGNKHPQMQKP